MPSTLLSSGPRSPGSCTAPCPPSPGRCLATPWTAWGTPSSPVMETAVTSSPPLAGSTGGTPCTSESTTPQQSPARVSSSWGDTGLPGSREGFTLQEERLDHCSIQTSPGTIVLTGGYLDGEDYTTSSLVTEYSGLGAGEEVTFKELPPLLNPRSDHACGWYSVGDSQVRLLTPRPPSLYHFAGLPCNRWL